MSLEWNDMGKESSGLMGLLDFVSMNKSLRKLDLRNNSITGVEADTLAKILKSSQSLVMIDLRWNALGNKGAKILYDAVKNSPWILKLDLNGNTISEEILREIDAEIEMHNKANPQGLRNTPDIFNGTNTMTSGPWNRTDGLVSPNVHDV